MNEQSFKIIVSVLGLMFFLFFVLVVIPPLLENPDIIGAFAAGFVNPYSSGYSADVIFCWAILATWVWYEASQFGVRHGWACLLLGIVPGVAVGFALYLVLRQRQVGEQKSANGTLDSH